MPKDNDDSIPQNGTPPLPAELTERAPITFKGDRVLTTEMAAKAFGASERQLRDNYLNNEARFEAGKHFHKVVGAELKALKHQADFIGLVTPQTPHLTLWTERGIARHAKILETEMAWAIFEALEDTYFRVKAERERVAPAIGTAAAPARRSSASELRLSHEYWHRFALGAGLEPNQAALSTNRILRRVTGIDIMAEMEIRTLPAPQNEPLLNCTDIGKRLGDYSAREVNSYLVQFGYQVALRDAKDRLYYELTDLGRDAGGVMQDTAKSHGDGTPVRQLRWASGIIARLAADIARPETIHG